MASCEFQEGFIDFNPSGAGKPCKIWYGVYGKLHSGKRPLLVLHGGPGLSHDYLLSLTDLASSPYDMPVIFYDQLGCGRSTHLPEKFRDDSFWTEQLYLDELSTVLHHLNIQDDYHLLGQSWGGMLASTHAARQPFGLNRLVLSGTPVSMSAWSQAYRRYREQMPAAQREVLKKPRDWDSPDTPEYEEAIDNLYALHVNTVVPLPGDYLKSFEFLKEDPTVALSTLGPSEFECLSTGFLAARNITPELQNIKVPTLLFNGVDEGADDTSMKVFQTGIANVRWIKFTHSTHMPNWEEREKHMKSVAEFLNEA